MSVESGGAPWLENLQKLVKTDNKAEIKIINCCLYLSLIQSTPEYMTKAELDKC